MSDFVGKREHIHLPANLGEMIADAVCTGMGSWGFVICQSVIVAIWIILNVWLLKNPFDPYPLILLNLVFSTQAAYASPLILMSQNRQAKKDRVRDDTEAQEVKSIFESHDLLLKNYDLLLQINKQQLEILNEHKETLMLLKSLLEKIQK